MIDHRYTLTAEVRDEIEALLTRFEQDRERCSVDLNQYTPDRDDPAYGAVVTELSRIDLEYRFGEGGSLDAGEYVERFADVFADRHLRTQLAFEEYRLRRRRGEDVTGTDVASKYDVPGDRWPQLKLGDDEPSGDHASLKRYSGIAPSRPKVHYPSAGETFAGFPLVKRIGEGAFSRVFLARQGDLAGRLVVLKLTPLSTRESDRLASLQHTSIIPVYSIHREQDLNGICMPFLGTTTLADFSIRGRRWASLDGPAVELVSTLRERHRSTIRSLVEDQPDSIVQTENLVGVSGCDSGPSSESFTEIGQYADLPYVDALVDLVTKAVEGLAHAHRRGIIHRDLKPANILVADDGTPVLLDFNLAASEQDPAARVVGGTLPYMSAQQLESLETGVWADMRDDVFSIGVILYELLTGQLPFETPRAGAPFELRHVIEGRRKTPTCIQSLNASVSSGLAAIIAKCLATERTQRYQDATELLEDLKRHRESRPLKHVAVKSIRERFSKWCVRHPRIASGSTVAMLATLILLTFAVMIWRRGQRIANLNTQSRYQAFERELPNVILQLSTPGREVELLSRGLTDASRLMSDWQIGSERWQTQSDVDRLPLSDRETLTRRLGSLAYLMSEAHRSLSVQMAEQDRSHEEREAARWKHWGMTLAPELETQLSARNTDAGSWKKTIGRRLDTQPTNVTLWFDLAVANSRLGDAKAAASCFDVANRLQPGSITTLLNRGLCHLDLGNNRLAFHDFDRCVRIAPELMVPRFNRAVALHRMGNHSEAIKDLDQLVRSPHVTTRMILFRAEVLQASGDSAAAAADRARALNVAPRDANDWVARGVSKMNDDPQSALDDFLSALRIQPSNVHAIQNAAHLYAERLQMPSKSINILSRLIELRPQSAAAVASRGIVYARQGESEAALNDAISAASLSPQSREKLQIAGIYAMVGAQHNDPDHRTTALTWLASALREDVSIARIAARDDDLAELRTDQRFGQLIGGARVIDLQSHAKTVATKE